MQAYFFPALLLHVASKQPVLLRNQLLIAIPLEIGIGHLLEQGGNQQQ
jgi:TRAP-type mannitol/chloroaromatic compound transport system permease large subunit